MVQCSVMELPVRAVDRWKCGGGCEVREIIWDRRRTGWVLQWALYQMVARKSDVKHVGYAWDNSGGSALLIMPEFCPGQCSNQMSVREGKMRTFDIFTFYRWLQFISKGEKEHSNRTCWCSLCTIDWSRWQKFCATEIAGKKKELVASGKQ